MKLLSGSFMGVPNLVWIAGGAGAYLWWKHSHATVGAPDLSTTAASPMPRRPYKSKKKRQP